METQTSENGLYLQLNPRRIIWRDAVRIMGLMRAMLIFPLIRSGIARAESGIIFHAADIRKEFVSASDIPADLAQVLSDHAKVLTERGFTPVSYGYDPRNHASDPEDMASLYLHSKSDHVLAFMATARMQDGTYKTNMSLSAWDRNRRFCGVTNQIVLDGPMTRQIQWIRDGTPSNMLATLDRRLPADQRADLSAEDALSALNKELQAQMRWRLEHGRVYRVPAPASDPASQTDSQQQQGQG